MARRVTVDNLSQAIADILDEYGDEISENSNRILRDVSKKGVQALRSASGIWGGKKYRAGWKVDFEEWRYSIQAHIWNAKVPGLPHLLENGHLLRNGKRWAGRTHIEPVERELRDQFVRQMEVKLSK